MSHETAKGFKKMRALLAAVLVCALLFSALFLAFEADHDCHGEDCSVCALLTACAELLQRLLLSAAVPAAAVLLLSGVFSFRSRVLSRIARFTPVALKVKLSD